MLAIIIYVFSLLWPYIIIVSIGNFITRQILENSNMQSNEEEDKQFENTTEKTKLKKPQRSKKSKSNKTSEDLPDISIDAIEDFLSSLHEKPSKYHPFYAEEDLSKDVTKIFNVKGNMSKFFVVNEDVFFDTDPAIIRDEQYHGYQVYKVMRSPEMEGMDEDLTEEDLTEDLLTTEETTKHGVIINSNVYLTTKQWHTIRELDKDIFSCTVCQFQCDAATVSAHVRSVSHFRKLDAHRPLKRFDLSITRKINENLHCAVCNVIYPIEYYHEHENSKSHEEILLTAINKVTDILYDDGHNKKTTLSFNNNNIQAPNNAPNQWLNFSDLSSPRNEVYRTRNEAYSPRNENLSSRNEVHSPRSEVYSPRSEVYSPRSEVYSPRNENYSPRNESFIPSYEDRPRKDSNSENRVETKEFEAKNFHYKNMFGEIKIYEEDDIEEYTPPIEGISYASMASKPRVNVPKFLIIDLGAKEVRVKYESWNMITQIDSSQVYCMVCKCCVLLRNRIQHCMADEHKTFLANCLVVGAFEDYLIRDVNDKLYHCGHCNNLQVKNDILLHIQKYHPMKNGSIKDINPLQIFPEPDPVETISKSVPKQENINLPLEQANKEVDIFADYKFSPFGTEMMVSNLGCHTLMYVTDRYVCALCNVVIQDDLLKHVYEPAHVHYIDMTPFIRPFENNLIRAIRGSLHCLLCNELVSVRGITSHNMSAPHTNSLARALGMRRSERPTHEVKYQRENPSAYKSELDRFLSTLPPESRAKLSQLTITNHKGELIKQSGSNSSSTSLSVSNSPTPSEVSNYPQEKPGKQSPSVPPAPTANNYAVANSGSFPPLPSPLLPGRMLTVSMVESGLPGVRTGSPVAAFRPPLQLQVTGPMDVKLNPGFGSIPVSPITRKEDKEVANDLLSLYKQSPVKHKAPMATLKEATEDNLTINIEDKKIVRNASVNVGEKTEIQTKTQDKTASHVKKKKIGKGKVPDEKQPLSSVSDDEDIPFKLDEPVLLKLKTSYFKVTNTAYQTLVHLSNGRRFCFVCSLNVDYIDLQKHVDGREHIENMAKNKFLCNFYGQLLRQMYLIYHCAICNVTMSRREIKAHLLWPTHLEKHDVACKKLNKKILKEALRQGVKELLAETQKEFVYVNIPEPSVNIVTYVQSAKEDFVDIVEGSGERKLVKNSQMIIFKGTMLKISFESWHGIATTKAGTKCILCQAELTQDELPKHVESKYHNVALGMPFHKQYYPALLRKINENTINCVICNLEIAADDSLVAEHISGRKHEKNYSSIVERTSQADCYSDCYKYPLTL